MPANKQKPEEIIGKLREVEIMLGQGGLPKTRFGLNSVSTSML
jgi:hypothetical protein